MENFLNKGYFSPHNHTEFSNYRLLDSINKPQDLFDRSLEIGLTGFAITDHEVLSAHVEIMKIRDKMIEEGTLPEGFTVAFGNESYLVDELVPNQNYYHWLIIAKDRKGHDILRELSSQAWVNSFFDRGMERVPITKDQVRDIMEEHGGKGHLMVTSACLGGELGQNALAIRDLEEQGEDPNSQRIIDKKQAMVEFLDWNIDVFGKEDFYIELAPNDRPDQLYSNWMLSNLAKAYGLKLIFSTDSHYASERDQDVHRAFLNSKGGEREVDEFYSTAYMMHLKKVWEYFEPDFTEEEFREMVHNLEDMRSKIEDYTLFHDQIVPEVDVEVPTISFPIGDINEDDHKNLVALLESGNEQDLFWSRTCLNELYKRGKWEEEIYLETLEKEAEVMVEVSKRMDQNITSYHNTAMRIVEIMWTRGDSLVGPSRGSALSFVSNWLLDIVQIDPIPYGIPYWRYLSKSRPQLPE